MREDPTLRMEKEPVVLMADDDEDDCMLARDAFEESNVRGTFHCVENGVELLDYLFHSGKQGKETHALPALILLDLNMPRKNGRQALTEIKSLPAFQNIPIVVLTTSRQEKDVIFCREMGAKDCITKPTLFSEWVEMMVSLAKEWLGSIN
jgi:CheY-like chemotaxis protein